MSDSLDRKPVYPWFVLGLAFGYLALTLLFAVADRPPVGGVVLTRLHAMIDPIAQALPGTGAWQWALGLDRTQETSELTLMQPPYIVAIVLAAAMALCGTIGHRNKARNSKDAEIVREERLKHRTRERLAMQTRR